MLSKEKRLVLIDGYGFLFRAYHSMPPLKNPAGLVVGALYGYSNMILKIRESLDASHIAVILDSGSKTFRNDIYAKYKANRPPAPEDLIPQFPLVREVSRAMNIVTIDQKGVEADDIIATLATKATKEGFAVTVISSDKDLMQLIDEQTSLYDPLKQKIIDKEAVFEKFGVYPKNMLDLLALSGDASDNIPGVAGIGPKTAAELIGKYNDLVGIYENIEEIKQPKRKQTLIDNKENAFLSERLVSLKYDVILEQSLDDLSVQNIDIEKLGNFFMEHGFKTLVNKIGAEELVHKNREALPIYILEDISHLENACSKILLREFIIIEPLQDALLLISEKEIFYIKYEEHNNAINDLLSSGTSQNTIPLSLLIEKIEIIFKKENLLKIFKDFKAFYRKLLSKTNKNIFHLNKLEINNHFDLTLSAYLLQRDLPKLEEETKERIPFYALELADFYKENLQSLIKHNLLEIFYNVDLPFNKVLLNMEEVGVKISQEKLINLTKIFAEKILVLEKEIFQLADVEFNIASPKQLGEILFVKLGLVSKKKSKKTKSLSTSSEVLQELAEEGNLIAEKIITWRHYSKLKGTYTESLPKLINKNTNRVHSTFSNVGTTTGRLSSSNPNLQNIPVRSVEGDKIRAAFIAEEGKLLISSDYSQIELRLLAHLAKIKKLQDGFSKGLDIHSLTASEVFSTDLDKVDESLRRKAKAINFGIIYGMSSFGLAARLGISIKDASDYIEKYFARYPEIKTYMDSSIENCKKTGFVETILGRKLFFANINNPNNNIKSFTERAVINAPLQGSAADIMKLAMLELDETIQKNKYPMRLILQIHDELVYEVDKAFAEQAKEIVKNKMENIIKLSLPLTIDSKVSTNWAKVL